MKLLQDTSEKQKIQVQIKVLPIFTVNYSCLFEPCPNDSVGSTATVAWWLERRPHEWEVVGSIPGCDRPMSVKLVVVAFLLGAQDYGNSTMTGPPVSG